MKMNIKINLLFLLTIIFIILKMTGNIKWSWFWVISPTLIPFLIRLTFFAYLFCFENIYVKHFASEEKKKSFKKRKAFNKLKKSMEGVISAMN